MKHTIIRHVIKNATKDENSGFVDKVIEKLIKDFKIDILTDSDLKLRRFFEISFNDK